MWKLRGRITDGGPLVDVLIGQPGATAGLPMKAMIDTGGSHTTVRPGIPQRLALSPLDRVEVKHSDVTRIQQRYAVCLAILGPRPGTSVIYDPWPVTAMELMPESEFDAILGCDLLEHFVLVYHGPKRLFTLTHRPPS
jgi:hypothetical protein